MPIVIKEIVIKAPPPPPDPQPASAGGEIHIESFSWGASQIGAPASHFDGKFLAARDLTDEQGSIGKATFKEFTVTKKTDTAPATGGGEAIEETSFTWGETSAVEVELPTLLVTSYQVSGHGSSAGAEEPVDDLLLADGGGLEEAAIDSGWRNYRVSVDSID
jgi:hypothetical protein